FLSVKPWFGVGGLSLCPSRPALALDAWDSYRLTLVCCVPHASFVFRLLVWLPPFHVRRTSTCRRSARVGNPLCLCASLASLARIPMAREKTSVWRRFCMRQQRCMGLTLSLKRPRVRGASCGARRHAPLSLVR